MTVNAGGGSVFPDYQNQIHARIGGLSLRDYFAGQALALGGEFFHSIDQRCESVSEHVAMIAYAIADAMIEARTK